MSKPSEPTLDETRTRDTQPFSPTLARRRSFEPPVAGLGVEAHAPSDRVRLFMIALGLLATLLAGYLIGTQVMAKDGAAEREP